MAESTVARAEDAANQVQDSFAENPLTALGMALAVGFVLAVLMRRPKVKILYVRESA